MKFPDLQIPNMVKSFSKLEIVLLVFFIIYLVLPIDTPAFLAGVIDSPLGMLSMFIITVYLFVKVNPILAVIYIFVAYELLRRSSNLTGRQTIMKYTPSQRKKDSQMRAMNPPKQETLEEEVVLQMAPIGRSDPSVYTSSTFKPVAENVKGASMD